MVFVLCDQPCSCPQAVKDRRFIACANTLNGKHSYGNVAFLILLYVGLKDSSLFEDRLGTCNIADISTSVYYDNQPGVARDNNI